MTIFPYPFQKQSNGCLAVMLKASRWDDGPLHAVLERRPRVSFEGQVWQAPRLSFHLNKHNILCSPVSLKTGLVLHSCDHKWCIESDHLSLGDCSRNQKEALERNPLSLCGRRSGGVGLWASMTNEKRLALSAKKSETMKRVLAEKRGFMQ